MRHFGQTGFNPKVSRPMKGLFGGEISNVTSAFPTAGIAMATFATISLFTAGIVATAFMGSIAVLMTLGVVGAAQAQQVKDAWTQTGKVISQGMMEASRAYVPVLQRLAVGVSAAFTQVQPALTQVFDRLAPLFEDLSNEFIGWLTGLINEMPDMVNRTSGFFASISGAWDQATDNMRAGWHEVVVSVLQFGPTLLNEGLPPFGEFVGRVLALLAPVVQISSTFAGPLFTSLAMPRAACSPMCWAKRGRSSLPWRLLWVTSASGWPPCSAGSEGRSRGCCPNWSCWAASCRRRSSGSGPP